MGLPNNPPQFILNGTDPGDLGPDEDAGSRPGCGMVRCHGPDATILFVCSKSATTDGMNLSAQYIVNNNSMQRLPTS